MTDGTQNAPDVTPDLRLRPERPQVTRLSRKVLIGLGAVSGLTIAAALIYALQTRRADPVNKELYATENRSTADGLTGLPRDYTGIPKLGPPLPGDLGRPILSAQNQGQPIPPGGPLPQPGITPEDQRRLQEMQDRKLAFVNGPIDRRTVSQDRLANPASPYVVQAGTVIPAALLTGIQSDLPGQVTAQVTEHVFDTPTGKFLLIPQGARLIGQYDSQISFGQKRVLLVWNRIMLPDGKSIVLERQQGADARGFSGLEDEVDYHWWDLIKAAALSTLLSVGAEVGSDRDESDLVRALRRGSQDSINNTGQQLVRRQLNIQPTLTIRQGFPVRVIINRDLVMAPYGQQEASR